ncbi:hypothetical protein JCM3770_004280 [Rhodotorula araucariae]
MTAATASTTSSTAPSTKEGRQDARADAAREAITHKPPTVGGDPAPLLSPSLQAIWQSFLDHGHGDTEMLRLIISAKQTEDARLKALDELRLEQQRTANLMYQSMLYQQMLAFAAAQPQQAALVGAKGGPPPYSPLTPPLELVGASPAASATVTATKRPRATSSASAESATSDASGSKKAKTARSPLQPLASGQKPTHADVMAALRRKCEANQQAGAGPVLGSQFSSPAASTSTSPPYAHRPLVLAPTPIAAARPSMSPPLATAGTRRLSPPQVVPGRHTSFLRPAPAPPASSSSISMSGLSALTPVPEADAGAATAAATTANEAPRNKLALLLHASESTAQYSPSWQPHPQATTSDVRGPVVPAPAVVTIVSDTA